MNPASSGEGVWLRICQSTRTYCSILLSSLVFCLPGCIPDGDSSSASTSPADLAAMDVAAGPLSPGFSPGVTNYDVLAPNGASTTTLTATPVTTSATLQVNNQPAAAGQPFGPIALDVGINPVTVLVDALGTTKSYTVIVTRGGPADLFGLELSAGPLSPDFDPLTTNYSVSAPSTTAQTTVTATLSDPRATLRINGQAAVSGQPFGPVNLAVGANTLTIAVTAVNAATRTYTVLVNRAGPGNANLSALLVSAGSLSPAFNPNTVTYAVTAAGTTTSTMVTAATEVATSSLSINGSPAVSGVAFGPIALNPAGTPTILSIAVRSQDGVTVKTYTVVITRGVSSNANLANLVVSAGPLKPAFSPSRTSYDVEAASGTLTTTVTATVQDAGATLKINGATAVSGQPFGPIVLLKNDTRVTIEVRAQNGSTKSYRVTIDR